jgi:hypothetical protein
LSGGSCQNWDLCAGKRDSDQPGRTCFATQRGESDELPGTAGGARDRFYSPARRIFLQAYFPASKRRMVAIILAKPSRKPLCCGQ